MKFGFDLHGVLNESAAMRVLACELAWHGHEVYIITGGREENAKRELENLLVPYTHIFSITEYHEKLGTPMTYDEKGNPFMDDYLWDRTKGDYCKREGIHLHFDDSDRYGYFFRTPYARIFTKDKREDFTK